MTSSAPTPEGPWICWRCRAEKTFPHAWCGTTAACDCDECLSPTAAELAHELVRKFRDWEFDDGQPAGPADVWAVFSPTGDDDYGSELPPCLMAICTSDARAEQLRAGLWGGQPGDTYTEQIRTDQVIPD